jgi:hypothetical protein
MSGANSHDGAQNPLAGKSTAEEEVEEDEEVHVDLYQHKDKNGNGETQRIEAHVEVDTAVRKRRTTITGVLGTCCWCCRTDNSATVTTEFEQVRLGESTELSQSIKR